MSFQSARTRRIIAGVLALSSVLFVRSARAQSQLEQVLQQYNSETVRGYVQPLADLLSADLNAGHYHSAFIAKGKPSLALEIIVMGSQVKDEQKSYTAKTPTGFSPSTFQTATVFGGAGSTAQGQGGATYRGADGFIEASYLPFAVPQLRVSGIMGTEVSVRYVTTGSLIDDQDVPKPKMFGIGGRHSISQYISASPVDISIGAFYNSIELGDIVKVTTMSFGAQVGKSFSVLSLYGGVASESGKMKLTFTSTDPTVTTPLVDVDMDVERHIRATGGAALRLGPLHLFGDANFGTVTTFTGGLRLGF